MQGLGNSRSKVERGRERECVCVCAGAEKAEWETAVCGSHERELQVGEGRGSDEWLADGGAAVEGGYEGSGGGRRELVRPW